MRLRAFSEEKEGEITVFVSLTVLLVIALICVTLEGARAAAGRWYFHQAAEAAGESLMARYHSGLWENYRLLLYCDDGRMEEDYLDYLSFYSGEGGSSSFLSFSSPSVTFSGREGVLLDGGVSFLKNANAAMVFEEGKTVTEMFLKESGLLKQIKKAASFIQKLLSYGNRIVDLERRLGKIGSRGEKVNSAAGSLAASCDLLLDSTRNLKEIAGTEVTAELREARETDFLVMQGEVLTYGTAFAGRMNSLAGAAEGYSGKAEGLDTELTELTEGLEAEKDSFQADIWKALSEEASHVKSYAEASGEKEEFLSEVSSLCGVYETISPFLGRLAKVSPDTATKEELEALEEELVSYRDSLSSFTEFEAPEWAAKMEEPPEDTSFSLSLSWIAESLFAGGVLILFVEDIGKVSSKTFSSQPLPSESLGEGDFGGDLLTRAADRILFLDYLTTFFFGYTEEKERALSYEWEYLVQGRPGDRSNLVEELKELYLIREGVRFLENLMDPAEQKRAAQMAASCVGFTGNPAVVYVAQLLFLGLWAADDALLDVRALLRGEKVPFLPLGGTECGEVSYRDYLKLQMGLVPLQTLCGRAMDLIQNEIRKKEPDFLMENCLAGFSVQAEGRMSWLSGGVPAAAHLAGVSSAGQLLGESLSFDYQ